MVGRDLTASLQAAGETVVATAKSGLDIIDVDAVRAAVATAAPDIIVNCAAYTRVDDAETNEQAAMRINGTAVRHLADASNAADALLVHISTDFVFDGSKRSPYQEKDQVSPLSAYGRTKLAGEEAAATSQKHLIVRTAWLFGVHGPNFVEAIRNQLRKGTNPLRVVDDQRGRPTYTPHLAEAIIRLARVASGSADARGIAHYADEPECSWYDFAVSIVRHTGSKASVTPVSSDSFPRPARRPAYSVLSTERYEHLTEAKPESWEEGLAQYFTLKPA